MLDNVRTTLILLGLFFIIFTCILYLWRPSWVQIMNEKTGKTEIYWRILLSISMMISTKAAIIFLLVNTQFSNTKNIYNDMEVSHINSEIASAYQST